MSVPVASIIKGPFLKVLPKRQCEISFSIEASDGGEKVEGLLFEAVEAFKCTYLPSLGSTSQDLRRQSYGALISVGESPWLEEVKKSYGDYCSSARLVPKELHHLMITFDDGPCCEFICGAFKTI
ncbi:MAG: hypothetical protein EPN47_13260 [Acidobacteria bacterium]|nr:MAG: hypothetical protein EPN47_13260 [Acidobacteriota bacterium]